MPSPDLPLPTASPVTPTMAPTVTPPTPWHARAVADLLRELAVDPARGLTAEAVRQRLAVDGPNALPEVAPPSFAGRLLAQFRSPLVLILLVAAGLAAALDHRADAGVILLVVVANALIGLHQEGRADRSMAQLRQLAALRVRVWRDGAEQSVEARELVRGDVLLLAAGDAVGADARLLEAAQLQAAEAALTGESVPVAKSVAQLPEACGLGDRHNLVHAGTHITAGRARALVVATGAHSEVGRIADLTAQAVEPRTPLERRLDRFGRGLVVAALALFGAVMGLGLWRGLPLDEVLMVAISQMVSLVPEGLPVAITIALAVGMQRMAARGAIVRRLAAVETLGSTTVICSDKTGTLTRNEMTAVRIWLPDGRTLAVEGAGLAPFGRLLDGDRPVDVAADAALAELLRAGLLCSDADLLAPEGDADDPDAPDWRAVGDPTEVALVVLAHKADPAAAAVARAHWPREDEWPFDADTQLMATRHRGPDAPRRVYLKGSPEAVLRLCGGPAEAHVTVAAARTAAEQMAQGALRVLALAAVDDDPLDAHTDAAEGYDTLLGRARLLGLVGQIDPPRDEARLAVAQCRAAGIRTLMITGDHRLTGLAIARQLGIAAPDARAIDGHEHERMGEAELREALPDVAVFARVQPAQKLRLVQALQARGEVVAMTGDGVNDAPALARADVGVAMGRSGTEVAKGAAKIVLTDDNFATLVGAVEQGRLTWANLRKVMLYLFATSIDEVVVLMVTLLAGLPLPLQAVQILWVNLVTEGTLTVNLVLDPPEGDEMRRPPTAVDAPLFDRPMVARLLLMAGAAATLALGWFVWRLDQGVALETVRTEVFTLTVMGQWFNLLNCRSATRSVFGLSLRANPWLLGGLLAGVALQALVLYLPPLAALFHCVPLPAVTLLQLIALASVVLFVEEARKWQARRSQRRLPH